MTNATLDSVIQDYCGRIKAGLMKAGWRPPDSAREDVDDDILVRLDGMAASVGVLAGRERDVVVAALGRIVELKGLVHALECDAREARAQLRGALETIGVMRAELDRLTEREDHVGDDDKACGDEKPDLTIDQLGDAVEAAVPDGWTIRITMGRDDRRVAIVDPGGFPFPGPTVTELGFQGAVEAAIREAVELAAGAQK